MDDQIFEMLMKRFDTLEDQNKSQTAMLTIHAAKSEKVHKTVERHSAYFSILGLGVTPLLGWVAYKLGFKH